MRYVRAILVFAIFIPSFALAAGFAPAGLFLSKSSVTEGDTVSIYATVSNDAAAPFDGKVLFIDGSLKLGSVAVTLAAGEAQVVSISWKPAAGTHPVTAELQGSDGSVTQQQSANFVVAAAPQTGSTGADNSAVVESSQQIQQDISSVSPQAATLSQPLFTTIDSLRGNISDLIASQLGVAKNNLAGGSLQGIVDGTSTQSLPNTMGEFWFILWTIYLYLLTILQFLISNAAVFYPLLVIIFFYLLYKTYRWARRPSY